MSMQVSTFPTVAGKKPYVTRFDTPLFSRNFPISRSKLPPYADLFCLCG